jgi:hypothetical protein
MSRAAEGRGRVGRRFSTPIGQFARREKIERKERDEIYAQLATIQLNLKKILKMHTMRVVMVHKGSE